MEVFPSKPEPHHAQNLAPVVKFEIYHAISIGVWRGSLKVLVESAWGKPSWNYLALFEVLDGAIPPHWSLVVHEREAAMGVAPSGSWWDSDWVWQMGYEEMVASHDHNNLMLDDLDRDALAIFQRELAVVRAFHGD